MEREKITKCYGTGGGGAIKCYGTGENNKMLWNGGAIKCYGTGENNKMLWNGKNNKGLWHGGKCLLTEQKTVLSQWHKCFCSCIT